MLKSQFKNIIPVHVKTCKKIINQNGNCMGISCFDCPFCWLNSHKLNPTNCLELGYCSSLDADKNDELLVKNAKEFLEMYNKEVKRGKRRF